MSRTPPRHRPSRAALALAFAGALGACTGSRPVSGLKPVHPPAESGRPTVESLRPTFRWQAVSYDGKGGGAGSVDGAIRHPRYELRIWQERHGRPMELVYERRSLESASHRLEQELQPDTQYFWTVRVRFELDGKPRVSPWSRIGRRQETGVIHVPDPAYLRFETPSR